MPNRFARKWLAFDDAQPIKRRLARRFVVAVCFMLLITATLALLTSR